MSAGFEEVIAIFIDIHSLLRGILLTTNDSLKPFAWNASILAVAEFVL